MADGRMLKKVISQSRRLAELKTDSARLLYTWLLPHLDIKGRYSAEPAVIRGTIVPRIKSFTEAVIEDCLLDLSNNDLIYLYEVDGDNYLELRKFTTHQTLNPNREAPSKIPDPVRRKCLKKAVWDSLWNQWEQSDKKCPVCGKQSVFIPSRGFVVDGYIPLNIDHIIPLSKGGTDDLENLRIICEKCNKSKGNRLENYEIEDNNSRQTPDKLQTNSRQSPDELPLKIREDKIREANTSTPEQDLPVDNLMASLKTILDKTREKYPDEWDQRKILIFVQSNLRGMNHNAILHCLESLIKSKEKVKAIPQFLEAVLKIENGKYNAADEEAKNNKLKAEPINGNLKALLAGIGGTR